MICAGIFVQGCAVYHAESIDIDNRSYVRSLTSIWYQCTICGENVWGLCVYTGPIKNPSYIHNALLDVCDNHTVL